MAFVRNGTYQQPHPSRSAELSIHAFLCNSTVEGNLTLSLINKNNGHEEASQDALRAFSVLVFAGQQKAAHSCGTIHTTHHCRVFSLPQIKSVLPISKFRRRLWQHCGQRTSLSPSPSPTRILQAPLYPREVPAKVWPPIYRRYA